MSVVRAGIYIDGFNFYHAVHELNPRRPAAQSKNHLKWISYRDLAGLIIDRSESVEFIKLFTALPDHRPQSLPRHQEFLVAQDAQQVDCVLGAFKAHRMKCKQCGTTWNAHEEKESDVNMAIHLVGDCLGGSIDVAYLITTDSDLAAAASYVKRHCPNVQLVTVSTPGRNHSKELLSICHRKSKVTERQVETCLMPKVVRHWKLRAITATRPAEYEPPV